MQSYQYERILVHCSAGRGRTGTLVGAFCIAETLLSISEQIYPTNSSAGLQFDCEDRVELDPHYEPDDEIVSDDQNPMDKAMNDVSVVK